MAEKKELPIIKVNEDELRMGLHFAGEVHKAQSRLQTLNEAENAYIRQLAAKYGIDPNAYYMRDWLVGFEPIPVNMPHQE